jgi:hypothetical protein
MAYFPNAFNKIFVVQTFVGNLGVLDNDTSAGMSNGYAGFFDAKTWKVVPTSDAAINLHPQVVFAMGSYRATVDKIGMHGGYKETVKSQVIDSRYVHRFWKVTGRAAVGQIVQLGWDSDNAATAPVFKCGQTYHLRIDVKGSPALRLLDHHVYHTFDVRTKCCVNTDTPESVDPVSVFLSFAEQINRDPIVSQFINATVIDDGGTVNPNTYVVLTDSGDIADATAALVLTVGYTDTTFTFCSFDPRDHYELEPAIISSAQLVDETGYACSDFKQLTFTETQPPLTSEGMGGAILREMILFQEYRQEPFPWDARKKDIHDFINLGGNLVVPYYIYDSYYILHSTPRQYNPTGVYDNDLYLLRVCGLRDFSNILTDFETWFTAWLSSAESPVRLEDLTVEIT